jgi:hypothetical protein
VTRTLNQPPLIPSPMQHPPRQRLSSNAVPVRCDFDEFEIANGVALTNISLLSIGTGAVAASLPVTRATRLCYGLNKWAGTDGTLSS